MRPQFEGLTVEGIECTGRFLDDQIVINMYVYTHEAPPICVAEFTSEFLIGNAEFTENMAHNMVTAVTRFIADELKFIGLREAKNGALKGGR